MTIQILQEMENLAISFKFVRVFETTCFLCPPPPDTQGTHTLLTSLLLFATPQVSDEDGKQEEEKQEQ